MANYQVTLTEVQDAALSFVAVSQADWIENAALARCQAAIDEIAQIVINKCLETSTQIPGTKDEMVVLGFNEGWLKTAEQRNAEYIAEVQANLPPAQAGQ